MESSSLTPLFYITSLQRFCYFSAKALVSARLSTTHCGWLDLEQVIDNRALKLPILRYIITNSTSSSFRGYDGAVISDWRPCTCRDTADNESVTTSH